MTAAWSYYVESGQFMTELLSLTRNYPFCTDIIHEAHSRVVEDPASNRSWNLAWLILAKVQTEYGNTQRYRSSYANFFS